MENSYSSHSYQGHWHITTLSPEVFSSSIITKTTSVHHFNSTKAWICIVSMGHRLWEPYKTTRKSTKSLRLFHSQRLPKGCQCYENENVPHLPLLSHRRKLSRPCLFHTIYYQNLYLHSIFIQPPPYISSRVDHRQKVNIPHSNTSDFSYSFSPKQQGIGTTYLQHSQA